MGDNVDDHVANNNVPAHQNSSSGREGNAVSVRLPIPAFNRNNIELWFIQLDYWFQANCVQSDRTRFSTTVAALDPTLIMQVYDIVTNPPEENKYKTIKSAIIKHFADSEQLRIQKYVSGLQLGDRKPSHLLNELRKIGGDSHDETLLKGLWMQRLPIEVQTCLATVQSPLAKLAELADTVMDTFRVGTISTVTNNTRKETTPSESAAVKHSDPISDLRREIRELTKRMERMQGQHRRSRSSSRSRSASQSSSNSSECWFHRTFGKDAKNCRPPCSYKGTANSTKN